MNMRNDLIDSLLIGGGIGFVALALHMLTDGSAPLLQLVALVLAAIALFCLQIVLTVRRSPRTGGSAEEPSEAEQRVSAPRHSRRNPFFRELAHDWTGLDERGPEQQADPVPPWDSQHPSAPEELEM